MIKGLTTLQSSLPCTSSVQEQPVSKKHSSVLKLSNGTFIRKTTAVWLFQEGERVSSDRLFRVRSKQPFSSEANGSHTSCEVNPCREIDPDEHCSHSGPSASFVDLTCTQQTTQLKSLQVVPISSKWLKIGHIYLYQSDKIAITGNDWLNDQHIHVAQTLIKQQHPHINGLYPTVLQGQYTLPEQSLQIIHMNNNHWIAASTIHVVDADIVLYDSKYSCLSESSKILLSKLIKTDKPTITIKMASVTKQSGDSDCGLFAIAYATHLSNGLDPSLCVFNQAQMRQHIINCFESENLQPFPIIKKRRSSVLTKMIYIKVYCYCRSIYSGEKMALWNGDCGEWYHEKCISTPIERSRKWYCRNCTQVA